MNVYMQSLHMLAYTHSSGTTKMYNKAGYGYNAA